MPPSVAAALAEAGGVKGLTRGCPSEARLRSEARTHQALADHTRLRILWALSEADLCPCVLKVVARVGDSKLSYHLRVLEQERLVRSRRHGSWILYSITARGLDSIGLERD